MSLRKVNWFHVSYIPFTSKWISWRILQRTANWSTSRSKISIWKEIKGQTVVNDNKSDSDIILHESAYQYLGETS